MTLVHDRRGAGDPLLLVHGLGSRWQVWEPLFDRLATRYELWSIDLPGFGASEPLSNGAPTTIQALTDAVEQFAADHGLDRPHIAGNSLGGGIALELAA